MSSIASTQLETGRFVEAANSYSENLKIFGAMPPKLALEPGMREEQGKIHDNLGAILILNGRQHDAEPQIQKGLEIREALLTLAPNRSSYLDDLGLSKAHLGTILANRGEPESARRLFEQAVELGQNALKADPRNHDARGHLRGYHWALAFFLLDQRAYVACAAVSADLLRDNSPQDQSDALTQAAAILTECAHLAIHDEKLPPGGRRCPRLAYVKQAASRLFQKAAENKKRRSQQPSTSPGFGLACPLPELCDNADAMRLARDLTKRFPERWNCWSILGVAYYYSADPKQAVSAFQKARELNNQNIGVWDFIAAMANWKLGNAQEARASFDRAQNWMTQNQNEAPQRRIRAQSAAVMGLPDSQ